MYHNVTRRQPANAVAADKSAAGTSVYNREADSAAGLLLNGKAHSARSFFWRGGFTNSTLGRTVWSTSMSKVPAIVPISDLREDAANILGRMKKSHEPVVITQRGRAAAVMVSVEEYERATHEREILRLLAQGDREAAAGKGYALEDVLQEADRILAK
jgi:prevent-host-death family protein